MEFNLVYDLGTKFGLNTLERGSRAILMSLLETARWEYYIELEAEGTEG